jgi:Uma2 family endonuclease
MPALATAPASPAPPAAPEAAERAGYVAPEVYLRRERARLDGLPLEWRDGVITPKPVASFNHTVVLNELTYLLNRQLRDGVIIGSQSMCVRVTGGGLYAYPDVVIVNGDPVFADTRRDMVLNPTLLVEVLSPSTRDYDQGDKFARYRLLPSLAEYVMIDPDVAHVIHAARRSDGWLLRDVRGLDATLDLASVDASLPLAEVYRKVDLDASAEPEPAEPESAADPDPDDAAP